MAPSPSSSAQAARERLGQRLRDLRLEAGLTGDEIGRRCSWSPAKTSRLERGLTAAADRDIRAWCTACGQPTLAVDLIAEARRVDELYMEWRRLHRHGLRLAQQEQLALHERARVQRCYVSNLIPGFLQTPAYARALLTEITRFQGTPNDVEEAVRSRTRRLDTLREGSRRMVAILEESVLRYRIGDRTVMTEQLAALLDVMSIPSLALGIIPFTTSRRTMWTLEAFYVYDDERVSTELLSAEVTLTTAADVTLYQRAFAELAQTAVYGPAARRLIEDAIASLSGPCARK